MKPRWSCHQAFVDEMVELCLREGIRTQDKIVNEIKYAHMGSGFFEPHLSMMDVSAKELIHKISLTTSREDSGGHRPIWCVPGRRRYLSVQRVKALTAKADALNLTPTEAKELRESVKDLQLLQDHWARKAKKAFQRVSQLEQLQIHATVSMLDLS